MKNLLIIGAIFLGFSVGALAQGPSPEAKQKMKKLALMVGRWKGEATVMQRGGAPVKVTQEEKIEYQLDSLLITFEGTGRNVSDPTKVSFHAFAVINFNLTTQAYNMRSFLMDGKQTDAFFNEVGPNKYDWGFDVPGGKIIYHITLDPINKKWNEKGEFSPDGKVWYPFFEMNLSKL
ncbi:MAG TPA: hypothetical protein VGK39_00840 [Cyclobacteriaceae bacterium]